MRVFLLTLFFCLTAEATIAPPHIGPEGLRFNRLHTMKIEKLFDKELKSSEDADIKFLLTVGKRASAWLTVVNAHRSSDNQLDLSSPSSTGGIPMDQPLKTSTAILMERYKKFLAESPSVLTDVLASNVDFPTEAPVADQDFLKTLRTLDRIYQSTIRWASSRNWMSWYINRAMFDVRGYHFLKNTPNLEQKLNDYSNLPVEEQTKLRLWLLGLCRNGEFDSKDCQEELNKHIPRARLYSFFTRFEKYGKKMNDLFYTIKKTRPEIYWNEDKTKLISPFQTPERADVQSWLKENVEDEWKTSSFNMQINYFQTTRDIPRIQFKEGVTANVNGIGGNLITMEAEYPIESNDQKWTIRHEYGHVLGFEDCYLEFYDTQEQAMIYYEIDVNNLMCSRKGHLLPTHEEQLRKSYTASILSEETINGSETLY